MNKGVKSAIARCSVAALYDNIWFDKDSGLPEEVEMTDYIEEEAIFFTCSKCKFSGPLTMFGELMFPHLQKDKDGYYLDDFETKVGPYKIKGKLYFPEEVVTQCSAVIRIYQATSLEELPETLCGEDTPLRQLALTKYKKLKDKKCQK